jgi:hypothetical protein
LFSVLLTNYSSDKNQEEWDGRGMQHVWGERCIQSFWQVNPTEMDNLEVPSADRRIILKWLFKKQDGGRDVDWIDLAQDRARCRAVMNTVMNHGVR